MERMRVRVPSGPSVKVNLWVKNPNDAPGIYVIIDFTNENGAYIVDNASGFGLWYSRDLKQTCPTCTTWAQIDFPLSSSGGNPVPVLAQLGGAYYIQLPLSGITNPGGGTKYFARVSVWNSNLTASNDAYVDDMEMTVVHDPPGVNQSSPLTELDHYTANVTSSQDYYAFGAIMPGRNYNSDSYKYGFGGQMKDDEIADVTGAHYTAEYWEYDSRLGRRWNTDPVVHPWESAYACFANNPIYYNDPTGEEASTGDDKNKGNTTGQWESHNADGTYTGKAAEPMQLPEIVITPQPQANQPAPSLSTTTTYAPGATTSDHTYGAPNAINKTRMPNWLYRFLYYGGGGVTVTSESHMLQNASTELVKGLPSQNVKFEDLPMAGGTPKPLRSLNFMTQLNKLNAVVKTSSQDVFELVRTMVQNQDNLFSLAKGVSDYSKERSQLSVPNAKTIDTIYKRIKVHGYYNNIMIQREDKENKDTLWWVPSEMMKK